MSSPAPVTSLLWLLAMLAAVFLVARPGARGWRPAATLVGLAIGSAVALLAPPRVEAVGVSVAGAAAWAALAQPPSALGAALGGLLAALAAGLFIASGMPAWLALALSIGGVGLALAWSRPDRRASASMFPGAFAVLACASLAAAAAPGVIEGWRSSQALNRSAEVAPLAVPGWTLALVVAAVAAGLFRGMMVRR